MTPNSASSPSPPMASPTPSGVLPTYCCSPSEDLAFQTVHPAATFGGTMLDTPSLFACTQVAVARRRQPWTRRHGTRCSCDGVIKAAGPDRRRDTTDQAGVRHMSYDADYTAQHL